MVGDGVATGIETLWDGGDGGEGSKVVSLRKYVHNSLGSSVTAPRDISEMHKVP